MLAYTAPLDLLVLLGFAPADHNGWRYYYPEDEDKDAYLQLTASPETGITVLSDNCTMEDGSRYKCPCFCGQLSGLEELLRLLVYCNWDFPDAFANEAAFEAHLVSKGFLEAI